MISELSCPSIIIDYVRYYRWIESEELENNYLNNTDKNAELICKLINNDIYDNSKGLSYFNLIIIFLLITLVFTIIYLVFKKCRKISQNYNESFSLNDDEDFSDHEYDQVIYEYYGYDNISYSKNNEYIVIE